MQWLLWPTEPCHQPENFVLCLQSEFVTRADHLVDPRGFHGLRCVFEKSAAVHREVAKTVMVVSQHFIVHIKVNICFYVKMRSSLKELEEGGA